jgi:AAA+ ATPase superfamily predicted ATPase
MKNPFDYSEVATEKLFVGREDAKRILEANIKSCQNTTIYGQRRVGKTSLVAEVTKIFKKKNKQQIFIDLDLSTCLNVQEFIESFCLALNKEIKKIKPLETKFQELGNYVRSIKPIAKLNSLTGEPEYSFDFSASVSKAPECLDDIFDLLESISKDHVITIILDEFQVIYYWNNSNKLQWQIRSRIQKQKNIGYIFLGSSQTLISKLFMESQNAFYKSTALIHLDNFIDPLKLSKWVKERFLSTHMSIGNEQIKEILDASRAHPYYTQKLCSFVWIEAAALDCKSKIDNHIVYQSIQQIVKLEASIFQERLDRLTVNQRKVIKALSQLDDEEMMLSHKTITEYSLPRASSVKLALETLRQEINPLIMKNGSSYEFEDPFFKLWLKG